MPPPPNVPQHHKFTTQRTVQRWCLNCIGSLTGATGPASGPPKPGDVSICLQCLHVAKFTATGLAALTTEERANVEPDIAPILAQMRLRRTAPTKH